MAKTKGESSKKKGGKLNKGLIVVVVLVFALAGALGFLSIRSNQNSYKTFVANGYIIDTSLSANVTDDARNVINFAAGSKYRSNYESDVKFSDTDGQDQKVSEDHFLHYEDESMGAFCKGSVVDVTDFSDENYGYYSITNKTILTKNGSAYELSSRGNSISLTDFVWKISDAQYMVVSPTITLNIGGDDIVFENYAQVTYIDGGIVRISSETATYETIATASTLTTENGQVLQLVAKCFVDGEGETLLALDSISVGDDTYVVADENVDDDDQITIPNFVVEDGESGESGSSGSDGDAGDSGSSGSKGTAGSTGKSGSSGGTGYDGYDGTSGSDGKLGKDGLDGSDGEDGSQAGNYSDTDSTDLNVPPTVSQQASGTLDEQGNMTGTSDNSYSVTSNSATMNLNLDAESGVVKAGSVRVYLYDKDTMTLVNSEEEAASMGSALENTIGTDGYANLNFNGLSAGTNYYMVVEGSYYPKSGSSTTTDTVFYSSSFTTKEVGIKLTKSTVNENSVSVKLNVTDSNVKSCYVCFYKYVKDSNNNTVKQFMAGYKWVKSSSNTTITYSMSTEYPVSTIQSTGLEDTEVAVKSATETGLRVVLSGESFEVKHNSLYYAQIFNVTDSNDSVVNYSGNEVKLQTLKKAPYYKKDSVETAVTYLQPTLYASATANTLSMELKDTVYDDDLGIVGVRFELFDASEYQTAIAAGKSIESLTPKYSQTVTDYSSASSKNLSPVSFNLNSNDYTTEFIGRVVFIFDNNDSEVEYSTDVSTSARLGDGGSTMSAEITNIVEGFSSLTANLVIHDPEKKVAPYIGGVTYPTITLYSDYDDTHVLHLDGSTYEAQTSGTDIIITFTIDNLYNSYYKENASSISDMYLTYYTIAAYGVYDADGNGVLTDAEKNSYYAARRVSMSAVEPMAMAVQEKTTGTGKTFEISFTQGADPSGTVKSDDTTELQTELNLVDHMTFKLEKITIDDDKNITVANEGNTITISTEDLKNKYGTDTDNFTECMAKRNTESYKILTKANSDTKNDGLSIVKDSKLLLTTKSFSKNEGSEEDWVQSGGYFRITLVSVTTKTTSTIVDGKTYNYGGNAITLDQKANFWIFKIAPVHLESENANEAVTVSTITNSEAPTDYKESDLYNDTVVGIQFKADYTYGSPAHMNYDVSRIKYTIFEVTSNTSETDIEKCDEDNQKLYYNLAYDDPVLSDDNPTSTNSKNGNLKFTPVLYGLTPKTAGSYQAQVENIQLYFNGNKTVGSVHGTSDVVSWYTDYLCTSTHSADGQTILKRGHYYFVTYEVMCNGTTVVCSSNKTKNLSSGYDTSEKTDTVIDDYLEVYPYCVYGFYAGYTSDYLAGGTTLSKSYYDWTNAKDDNSNMIEVPLYRSKIIGIEKQRPTVERINWDSDENSVTYNYILYDVDSAILTSGNTYLYKNGDGTGVKLNGSSDYAGTVAIPDTGYNAGNTYTKQVLIQIGNSSATATNGATLVKFAELSNNTKYSVGIAYRLMANGSSEQIKSCYEIFRKKRTIATADCGVTLADYYEVDDSATEEKNPDKDQVGVVKKGSTINAGINSNYTNTYFEKKSGVVNEGGYQYRLSIIGDGLKTYAAYRVVVTCKKASGETKTITYDPVYPTAEAKTLNYDTYFNPVSNKETLKSYLYINAGPLNSAYKDNYTTASFSVEGYYSTYQSGFINYYGNKTEASYIAKTTEPKTSLSDENMLMLTRYNSSDATWQNVAFDPSNSKSVNAFSGTTEGYPRARDAQTLLLANYELESGATKAAVVAASSRSSSSVAATFPIDQYYLVEPLQEAYTNSSTDQTTKDAFAAEYTANWKLASTSDTTYGLVDSNSNIYSVEKMATVDFGDDYENVALEEAIPATYEISRYSGATTLEHVVELKGMTDSTSTIYARVKNESTNKYLYLKPITKTIDGVEETYFEAIDISNAETDAEAESMKTSAIANGYETGESGFSKTDFSLPIYNSISKERRIKITGLDAGGKYMVEYYIFKNNAVRQLYNIDKSSAEVGYSIEMASSVDIVVGGASPRYDRYTSYTLDGEATYYDGKYFLFDYYMPNESGEGITIHWELYARNGNEKTGDVLDSGDAKKLGNATTGYYYSSNAGKNNKIQVSFNPNKTAQIDGNNKEDGKYNLKAGEKYILILTAKDDGGGTLGTKSVNVNPPSTLGKPDVQVTWTQSGEGDHINLSYSVTSKDYYNTIVDDSMKVYLYEYQNRTKGNLLDSMEINRQLVNSKQISNVYTLDTGTFDYTLKAGQKYYVELVVNSDLNNDGTIDESTEKMTSPEVIEASGKVTANSLNINGTTSKLTIKLGGLQNFENIDSIQITVYDEYNAPVWSNTVSSSDDSYTYDGKSLTSDYYPSDSTAEFSLAAFSWQKAVTTINEEDGSYETTYSAITSGNYTVYLQYRSNGSPVGTDSQTITVN